MITRSMVQQHVNNMVQEAWDKKTEWIMEHESLSTVLKELKEGRMTEWSDCGIGFIRDDLNQISWRPIVGLGGEELIACIGTRLDWLADRIAQANKFLDKADRPE